LLRFDTLRREESVGASALPAPSGIEFNDVDTPGGAIGKPRVSIERSKRCLSPHPPHTPIQRRADTSGNIGIVREGHPRAPVSMHRN
jgi:hypothetical protein